MYLLHSMHYLNMCYVLEYLSCNYYLPLPVFRVIHFIHVSIQCFYWVFLSIFVPVQFEWMWSCFRYTNICVTTLAPANRGGSCAFCSWFQSIHSTLFSVWCSSIMTVTMFTLTPFGTVMKVWIDHYLLILLLTFNNDDSDMKYNEITVKITKSAIRPSAISLVHWDCENICFEYYLRKCWEMPLTSFNTISEIEDKFCMVL